MIGLFVKVWRYPGSFDYAHHGTSHHAVSGWFHGLIQKRLALDLAVLYDLLNGQKSMVSTQPIYLENSYSQSENLDYGRRAKRHYCFRRN
jgi:hypothetical protein